MLLALILCNLPILACCVSAACQVVKRGNVCYNSQAVYIAGVWLNKEATNRSADTPQLTFSFQAQTQDISSNSSLTWQIAASTLHTTDEASLLRQALAGSASYTGIYLAPLLYRPTLQVRGGRRPPCLSPACDQHAIHRSTCCHADLISNSGYAVYSCTQWTIFWRPQAMSQLSADHCEC